MAHNRRIASIVIAILGLLPLMMRLGLRRGGAGDGPPLAARHHAHDNVALRLELERIRRVRALASAEEDGEEVEVAPDEAAKKDDDFNMSHALGGEGELYALRVSRRAKWSWWELCHDK